MFARPDSVNRPRLLRSFLPAQEGLALFLSGDVPGQEREELVPKHGFDTFEGVRRVPPVAFLDNTKVVFGFSFQYFFLSSFPGF